MENLSTGPLENLIKHEEYIAALYTIYGNQFPGFREFWLSLAYEEETHAELLRNLSGLPVWLSFSDTGRFSTPEILLSMNHLQAEAEKALGAPMNLIDALAVAKYIEITMLENHFFDICATDSSEMQRVFSHLTDSTREHSERIKDLLDEERERMELGLPSRR